MPEHHPYGTPKTEEEIIEAEAIESAKHIWGNPDMHLPYTHCTYCDPDDGNKPCVCRIQDMTTLCARHWIEDRIRLLRQLKEESRQRNKPSLDLEDFARL